MKTEKTKWVTGPGGMRCGCCRNSSRPKCKVGYRRAIRRRYKKVEVEA